MRRIKNESKAKSLKRAERSLAYLEYVFCADKSKVKMAEQKVIEDIKRLALAS